MVVTQNGSANRKVTDKAASISIVTRPKKIKETVHNQKAPFHFQKIRAAVYIRVSSLSSEQEDSIEAQGRYFHSKLDADPNIELIEIYSDHGRSGGFAQNRDEFQRMLEDAEKNRFDMIYVKSISRFARNLSDFSNAIQRLRECGVYVFFDNENLCTADRNTEVIVNILEAIAAEELRSLRENVRSALAARAATGHPVGKVAYGYRKIDKDANWKIDQDEAERVRVAYQLASEGICYREILGVLNEIELDKHTGIKWNKDRLSRMLTNTVYTGDVLTNKSYIVYGRKRTQKKNRGERTQYYLKEHHDAIISRKVYDRVQVLIRQGLLHSRKKRFTPEEKMMIEDSSWKGNQHDDVIHVQGA